MSTNSHLPRKAGTKFGWSLASKKVGSPSCPYLLLPNVNSWFSVVTKAPC